MPNKKLTILIVLLLVALATASFVLCRVWKVPQGDNTPVVINPVTDTVDTSDWKTYRNNLTGYEFKYPVDWELKEVNYSDLERKITFRYVTLEDNDFIVSVGIKNKSESEKISIRPLRTGIPAGDFEKIREVKAVNNFAEEKYLVYKNEKKSLIQLIWFCDPKGTSAWCDDFSIDENKSAFVGIEAKDELKQNSWEAIENDVLALLNTIRVLR